MERKQFEKNWNHYKNSIQGRWNKLTSEDIFQIDGIFDEFIRSIMKRYSLSRETAEREVENWHPQMPAHEKEWTPKAHGSKKSEIHEFEDEGESRNDYRSETQNPEWKQKKRKTS